MRIIILTETNEALQSMGEVNENRDLYNLQHEICCGFIDWMKVSITHSVLVCRKCGLRVPIPNDINTGKKLKAYFKAKKK